MTCILNIETATEVCSIAISLDGKIIFERSEYNGPSHSVLLGVFVKDALAYIKQQNIGLSAVAVSCGPGSYTGLRIGVSHAKGVCYGADVPLIAIPTLGLLAATVAATCSASQPVLLCPMIDARRMEVYDALYCSSDLTMVREVKADIIDETSFANHLADSKVLFFGNGAAKCSDVLQSANAEFVADIYPVACNMMSLSEAAFASGDFVDAAYFEPFYLKEFVATTPKNKVLPSF